jgi:DNA-binding NarL/FixJ family response regulator
LARLLVVDDEPLIRRTLRRVVPGFAIMEAGSCEVALEKLEATPGEIDLILLDVRFPEGAMQGMDALRVIRSRWPHVGIVVMTGIAWNVPTGMETVQAGALGFVSKLDNLAEVLPLALNRALRILRCRRELVRLERQALVLPAAPPGASGGDGQATSYQEPTSDFQRPALTPREEQVLALHADGFARLAIATHLAIKESTVDTHLDRIKQKTGLRTTAELTKLAIRLGLTKL